jgi:hypothetical protein
MHKYRAIKYGPEIQRTCPQNLGCDARGVNVTGERAVLGVFFAPHNYTHVNISLRRAATGHICTLDSGGVLALHL